MIQVRKELSSDRRLDDVPLPLHLPRRHIMAMPIQIPRYPVDQVPGFPDDGLRYPRPGLHECGHERISRGTLTWMPSGLAPARLEIALDLAFPRH